MEKFCHMPWYAITITGQGDIKPCCQFRSQSLGNIHNDFPNVGFKELYNSKPIVDIRHDFFKHKLSANCTSCWEREEMIGYSRRQWFEKKFSKFLPDTLPTSTVNFPQWIQMDINLSNACNLKCRMCGAWASDQWIEDEIALAKDGNVFQREDRPEKLKRYELSLEQLSSLKPHMENIQRIDFKGGEPMLARNHSEFLEMLIEMGINKSVTLHYTTNGTLINSRILNALEKFHKVEIVYSIEGTDPLYGYIRGGKKFTTDSLVENLKVYSEMPNISLMCNVAIQAYNLPNLPDLHRFILELPLKNYDPRGAFNCIVNGPKYLSPFVWPLKYRQAAAEALQPINEFAHLSSQLVEIPDNPEMFQKFLNFTKSLDKLRNENYFDIYPELRAYA